MDTKVATKRTEIFFDFEFIDDGREIVPISVGMCTRTPEEAPGPPGTSTPHELYLEYEFDPTRCNNWVRENVWPHLKGHLGAGLTRWTAGEAIREWVKRVCGDTKPRFWGYYPSYDWVLLCQHYGTMVQGPKDWPIRPECLMQWADQLGVPKTRFPKQDGQEHNALADARWNRDLHTFLSGVQAGRANG